MNKKRIVILLSLSILIFTAYLYPQTPPWYTRIITLVQKSLWNPFVQMMRRLFRMDHQQVVQAAAMARRVQDEAPSEPFEYTIGGLDKANIIDVQNERPRVLGLIDGTSGAAELISTELPQQLRGIFLNPESIKKAFFRIEYKLISYPEKGSSASGFVIEGKKICLFNIGTSQTMLFKQRDNQLNLMFATVQHLIADKDERDRLLQKAQQTGSLITVQTRGRYGQAPTEHGMYFDSTQKKWVLEGLLASRFLGYFYQKNWFEKPIRKALTEPDVTCFSLESGIYYVVIATQNTHLTPKIILDAFASQLYPRTPRNSAFVSAAIEAQSIRPIEGKYIVVRCVIDN